MRLFLSSFILAFSLGVTAFAMVTSRPGAVESRPGSSSQQLKQVTSHFLLYTASQHFNLFRRSDDSRLQEAGEKLLETVLRVVRGDALLALSSSPTLGLEAWSAETAGKDRPALAFSATFIAEALSDPTASGGVFIKQIYSLARHLDAEETSHYDSGEEPLVVEAEYYREATKQTPSKAKRVREVLEAFSDHPRGPKWTRFVTLETRRDFELQLKFADRIGNVEEPTLETIQTTFRDLVAKQTESTIQDVQNILTNWRARKPSDLNSWTQSDEWKLKLVRLDGLLALARHLEGLAQASQGSEDALDEMKLIRVRLQTWRDLVAKESELLGTLLSRTKEPIKVSPDAVKKNKDLFRRWLDKWSDESPAVMSSLLPPPNDAGTNLALISFR